MSEQNGQNGKLRQSEKTERARQLVPTIMLTVLSMIQALALEFYWAQAAQPELLWSGGWPAVIAWLQVLAVLDGILLIWVFYVSAVLRFSWLPSLEDTLMPFLIGVVEFAMIELMHPDDIALWLLLMAAAFALTVGSGHMTITRASRDPANAYYFDQARPLNWGNYRESIITISLLVIFGISLLFIDSLVLSLLALAVTLAALTYQLLQARLYWMHSLDSPQE